ncbi:polyhydroxyalkanoic acid system family protein [Blastopirellula retiformator]|uniref:Putative polyhydroxyalkanoic acid system protein n=1 Tax=Blastopirellula retiformator TaxID=2527970 RepID=A0A5C5UYN1_9BACT|nr:polyhydroxyalkanoic acid system family protein [Blastopirellula retiformator]TWT31466.1 putative polyhydroxyalkanoic acid system protein [Blastopirellula retiformator]
MPGFHVEKPHSLGQDAAIERVQMVLEKMRGRFEGQVKDMQQTWDEHVMSFSFRTMGVDIAGTMEVLEELVVVKGSLPFAAMLFKGRIEKSIGEELEKIVRS